MRNDMLFLTNKGILKYDTLGPFLHDASPWKYLNDSEVQNVFNDIVPGLKRLHKLWDEFYFAMDYW